MKNAISEDTENYIYRYDDIYEFLEEMFESLDSEEVSELEKMLNSSTKEGISILEAFKQGKKIYLYASNGGDFGGYYTTDLYNIAYFVDDCLGEETYREKVKEYKKRIGTL